MNKLADFLSELKHRRVFRVAAVYAGVAFVIGEIVDISFGPLGIPAGFDTAVIVLLILGFPIVIGLAWAFDITDEGIVRAKGRPADARRKTQPLLGNKSLAVIAVLAVIVAVWALLRSPGSITPIAVQPQESQLSDLDSLESVIPRIAVLPLNNQTGDPEQEFFVEGMHDAIITQLSRLSGLKVTSFTSSRRYKDTDKLLPEIARELNVDALVEASIFKTEDSLRITAQLIDGRTDEHLRSFEFISGLNYTMGLQRNVAGAIAGGIGLILTPEEEIYLASAPQVNPEAYELYIKAWHIRSLEIEGSFTRAAEYLEQAVALDSTFVKAWAALAHCMAHSDNYTRIQVKEAIDKALELDPNDAQAVAVLAYSKQLESWSAADSLFRRALELDPKNSYALYQYGLFLNAIGRLNEALEMFRRGREVDPLDPQPLLGTAWVYDRARQYDKALEYFQAILEISPGHSGGNSGVADMSIAILMQEGRYAKVAEQRGVDNELGMRARMAMGNVEEVHAFLDSLFSSGEYEQENPNGAARIYAIIGEKDKALSLLEGLGPIFLVWTVYRQQFDFLRAEPRFKALLKDAGLPELFDENGNLLQPLDETLGAYNAPGSR